MVGTSTAVGKTYVCAALARLFVAGGARVVARKPLQSSVAGEATDAEVLAAATGEDPLAVCASSRTFPLAMAPPMAAAALGWALPDLDEVLRDLAGLLGDARSGQLALVETVGGLRSPLCRGADSVDLVAALEPDATLLVAESGLGVVNAVRLATGALGPRRVVVYLNRFDANDAVHQRSLDWLAGELGEAPTTSLSGLAQALSAALRGS